MATDDELPGNNTSDSNGSSPSQEANNSQTPHSKPPDTDDRSLLFSKAKLFLQSPQVSSQDPSSKRQFLREKGFHDTEIDDLLRDLVSARPLARRKPGFGLKISLLPLL